MVRLIVLYLTRDPLVAESGIPLLDRDDRLDPSHGCGHFANWDDEYYSAVGVFPGDHSTGPVSNRSRSFSSVRPLPREKNSNRRSYLASVP